VNVEAVAESFMSELQDDYVGLWAIVWEVKRAEPDAAEADVRRITMSVVAAMLRSGEVAVGEFDSSRTFCRWAGSPVDLQERIGARWNDLGREPNIGDICWFAPS